MKIWIAALLLGLGLSFAATAPVKAQQDSSSTPPTDDELQKHKEITEKRAFALLDQLVDEAQLLRLPENRIRLQIEAADLLWAHNEERARSLFSLASDAVAELIRNANSKEERQNGNRQNWVQLTSSETANCPWKAVVV
jgi:hypothetical protein